MVELRQIDWGAGPLFDSAIVPHGFAPHMRDYDVIVEVPLRSQTARAAIAGRYRYRFTHCVEAHVETFWARRRGGVHGATSSCRTPHGKRPASPVGSSGG